MNELLEVLKTLPLQELHVAPWELSVTFHAPWNMDGNTVVSLMAATPQELTQAILRMTGGVDDI
jgi:hypothetical protein